MSDKSARIHGVAVGDTVTSKSRVRDGDARPGIVEEIFPDLTAAVKWCSAYQLIEFLDDLAVVTPSPDAVPPGLNFHRECFAFVYPPAGQEPSPEAITPAAAELERLRIENERLSRWKKLIEESPEAVRDVTLGRFLQTEQLQPIVSEWKKKVATLTAFAKHQDKVIRAARTFCQKTQEDMDALEGSISLDIPVEFTELHYAVKDFDSLAAPAPEPDPATARRCAEKLEARAAQLKTPPLYSYATPVARELLDQAAEIRREFGIEVPNGN